MVGLGAGLTIGVARLPVRDVFQELYFYTSVVLGGLAAALYAVVASSGRRWVRAGWFLAGLAGGSVTAALASAAGWWWVGTPTAMGVAMILWGGWFGGWCGLVRHKPLVGALLGLFLSALIAGPGLVISHPDPDTALGGMVGLFAGALLCHGPKRVWLPVARLVTAGLVVLLTTGMLMLGRGIWPRTQIYRLIDSGHSSGSFQALFSPDGLRVLTSHGQGVCLWSAADGTVLNTVPSWVTAKALSFAADDSPLFTSVSAGGVVQKFNVRTGELLDQASVGELRLAPEEKPYEQPVVSVSADASLAAIVVSGQHRLMLVDLATRSQRIYSLEPLQRVSAIVLSGDGRFLLAGCPSDASLHLMEFVGGELRYRRSFPGRFPRRGNLGFSPSGRHACAFGGDLERGELLLVPLDEGEVQSFHADLQRVRGIAFSADGRRLLSAEWPDTVRLWDVTSGAELRCFRQHESLVLRKLQGWMFGIDAVAFSPNGQWGLASSSGGHVSLWPLGDPPLGPVR
jgi:WD40 repeat protein